MILNWIYEMLDDLIIKWYQQNHHAQNLFKKDI